MDATQRSPAELLTGARAGRGDCLGELLQRFGNYLTVLSTAQLDAKLRGRVSPSDVVQETYVEAHRDFPQFRGETESEFTAWLRQILVQNLARAVERHVLAAKRDVRRERSMEELRRAVARSS
ncbi:MAG TPA: sigma factor, partial [Pirellulaceae bacterium]